MKVTPHQISYSDQKTGFLQVPQNSPLSNSKMSCGEIDQTLLEQSQRFSMIWKRAYLKIKAQRILNNFKNEILLYGTSNNLSDLNNQFKQNFESIIHKKLMRQESFRQSEIPHLQHNVRWYIFYPECKFLQFWNLLTILTLVYIVTLMPWRLAFMENVYWDTWTVFELSIDVLFLIDIFVNFLSGYYKEDSSVESSFKGIAKNYITTWFIFDVIASIPFVLIDYFTGEDNLPTRYNTFIKLVRLPKMYRLLRVFRIFKALKNNRESPLLEKVEEFLQINPRLYKLIKFMISICLSVHVAGCSWYFTAKLDGFGPESWVVRHNFYDNTLSYQYLASIYWAFTSISTVGYGDIHPKTEAEIFLNLFWMAVGVGFYSYIVGSLISILTEADLREHIIASKEAAIDDFQRESGISLECTRKMKKIVSYNCSKGNVIWQDRIALFRELPKNLQLEIALTLYGGAAKELTFFLGKDDSFIIEIMPMFRPLMVEDGEYVYKENEYADALYLISRGRVNLVLIDNIDISYKSYLKGSYFGDTEIFNKLENRLDTAQACGIVEMLYISKREMLSVLEDFPYIRREFKRISVERLNRHRKEREELRELIQLSPVRIENMVGVRKETQTPGNYYYEDSEALKWNKEYEKSLDRLTAHLDRLEGAATSTNTEMQKLAEKLEVFYPMY